MSTRYAIALKLAIGSTVARDWYIILRLDAQQQLLQLATLLSYCSSWSFAPADLSSSAEHDVVNNDIIIDGPLRCSSWFSFDVPADPSSSSSACSWFISFQMIHYAPAGSTGLCLISNN
ncbi:hypothetical protein F511_03813 [Dorcoceras hygrometricum]|uniref:Uncharacterized protein n=1 Tax=Dorcoceras hygrometricum TaxID=472368 RepID=A0A2Z7BNZ5_9LAMI|nr:hypothetical protein F511_03813 [Dorcoceras hygrometricum]